MKNYIDAQCVLEATGVYIKIPLSPQKESRKSLKNKHLRLFLCPENCTKNAPTFIATPKKSPFEGVPMGFYPIFTGAE